MINFSINTRTSFEIFKLSKQMESFTKIKVENIILNSFSNVYAGTKDVLLKWYCGTQ